MKTLFLLVPLALLACGGDAAEGSTRPNDPNRQQKVVEPTQTMPPPAQDMPGKGKGSETKWDQKLQH